MCAARDCDVPAVLARAIEMRAFDSNAAPVAIFYDENAYDDALKALLTAFPGPRWLHAKAVKSNPLRHFLRRCVDEGLGLECAVGVSP